MRLLRDFKQFAQRGNLVDLTIGFTVGVAFTSVARSLVGDVIMPPIGLAIGRVDFADLYVVLREGTEPLAPDAPLAAAQATGAVTLNYGLFINNLLAFVLVAAVMFLLIRGYNALDDRMEREFGDQPKEPEEPANKKCRYCLSTIPYRAIRCPACTSDLHDDRSLAGGGPGPASGEPTG